MKIRNGYVSNSSSSSFCILGFVIDQDNLPQKIQEKIDNNEYDLCYLCENYNNENKNDKLKMIKSVDGIYNYYDHFLIGANPNLMKDNQTLLEFKNDVLKEIHKIGFTDIKIEDLHFYIDGGNEN